MLRSNLSEILVFMAVVDEGSFVAGGKAMGLSRSAAGKSVSRLEDRLGARLLNRTTRTLGLTDEGRLFYDRGAQILAAVDDAESSMAGRTGTPRGLLRLTVPDAYGRIVLLPVLRKYLDTWPDVRVEVSFTDRKADLIEEGLDMAVRMGGTNADTRLVSRVVARCKALLCASPSYLQTHGEPTTVEALAGHECLIYSVRHRPQTWPLQDAHGEPFVTAARSRLALDSGEALRDAAVSGFGIAFLPDFLVAADLAAGRLRRVLPDQVFDDVDVVTIYPTRRLLEPRVRRFIDLLVEELGT